jgi:hypothetical protein
LENQNNEHEVISNALLIHIITNSLLVGINKEEDLKQDAGLLSQSPPPVVETDLFQESPESLYRNIIYPSTGTKNPFFFTHYLLVTLWEVFLLACGRLFLISNKPFKNINPVNVSKDTESPTQSQSSETLIQSKKINEMLENYNKQLYERVFFYFKSSGGGYKEIASDPKRVVCPPKILELSMAPLAFYPQVSPHEVEELKSPSFLNTEEQLCISVESCNSLFSFTEEDILPRNNVCKKKNVFVCFIFIVLVKCTTTTPDRFFFVFDYGFCVFHEYLQTGSFYETFSFYCWDFYVIGQVRLFRRK